MANAETAKHHSIDGVMNYLEVKCKCPDCKIMVHHKDYWSGLWMCKLCCDNPVCLRETIRMYNEKE
jgi:ribosomal protein L37AE/L43A